MPGVADAVTKRLTNVADDRSIASVLRARRWEMLLEQFPELAEMRVLDVGGTAAAWALTPVRPASLTLLNIPPASNAPGVVYGDACDPPAELLRERFDLVYSNSVLEHVGGHWRRIRFSETVHALAERHWVQTPYRYFPIEAHALMPGLQWLPTALQARALRHWPIGNMRRCNWSHLAPDVAGETGTARVGALRDLDLKHASRVALGTELLSITDMQFYFPGSTILRERMGPLVKSLIAVR